MNVTVKGSNRVIGLLSFDFTVEGFTKRLNRYTRAKGEFIVPKADGTVLYDFAGHFYDPQPQQVVGFYIVLVEARPHY